MTNYDEQYKAQITDYLSHVDEVYQAFQKQCEDLKDKTEKDIATLNKDDKDYDDKKLQLKLKLRQELEKIADQYEDHMRGKFITNVELLEDIFHKKELLQLDNLDKDLETAFQNVK